MMNRNPLAGMVLNLANAARLSAQNLADDPAFFILQILRKFCAGRRAPGIMELLAGPKGSHGLRAIAALLQERRDEVARIAQQWETGRRGGSPALMANILLAAGHWNHAERILDHAPPSTSVIRGRARLLWALGHMDESIGLLESAPGTSRRQLRHYRSERLVFNGWTPVLPPCSRDWELDGETRVLYLATNSLPYTSSGYTQRTHSLLGHLHATGTEVVVATRAGYPVTVGNLLARSQDVVGHLTYRRLLPAWQRFDMGGRIQQQTELLARLVQELRPTVLHTTTDFSNAVSVRAVAEAYNLPWVYEVRGQLADTWASTRPAGSRTSQRYRLFQAREAASADAADCVLTLGESMRANLLAAGVAPGKTELIPNAVGEQYLEAPVPRTRARQILGLDPTLDYVGTISSLVPYEGLDLLVRMMAELDSSHPKLHLLIVGDGTERRPLMELAGQLGVADRCHFPGRVDRAQGHLYHAALDVFMVPRLDLPVTREVTPLKPVEAMASAVPVMASDLPALAELFDPETTGILVPAGDVQAWCERLGELLGNEDKRARIGAMAREYVLAHRTWNRNAEALNRIYSTNFSPR
ncbi:glycosyltransferase family 4 protein [Glutamicibacter sp. MNS18]|uniref:glycosyltransferase family 4 protein n=1 Tax=Glutamicibacter sp. MNS18 TaxID=2989817 RepID=UPI002236A572|nr:glycosyltransferase family 4 protein [Glutamicibacter sp. MNS18]MCW4466139.1 glycosyltransferase family 4 protein [Glutamicibacter sp. MNS18]